MNFNLTPALEQFVRDRAASGQYNNASEVVREALRLLQHHEENRALKMERLRLAIREGDEAIARGDFVEIKTNNALDSFFGDI